MTPDVHTLAGAYAVDALPPDERALFERHLDACDACRREVAELTATAGTLGAAAAETPPSDLRDRVLAEAGRTRQLPPIADQPDRTRRFMRLRPLPLPAAAALVVFALVLGGVTAVLLGRIGTLEQQLAQTEPLAEVLADPGLRVVDVDAPEGASARLLHSRDGRRVVLVVEGLTPPAGEHTYQLWVLRDGVPVPDRLFSPDERGRVVVAVGQPVRTGDGVAATIEPSGGSPQPTGEIVLQGTLDA